MKNGLEFNKHLTISGKRRENCRLTLDVEECANSQPSATVPDVLRGRILANATVPLVMTDALYASDLLPKMRIHFSRTYDEPATK